MNNILKKDFYDSIMNEFKNIDYDMKELPQNEREPFNFHDIQNLFLIYVNWRKRFISPGFRKVVYSKELNLKLKKQKKLKKIVEKIEYKFKNNEDLTPFLTKMIVNKPYIPNNLGGLKIQGDKDLLLNFFGIQHIHLETNYNKRATKGINFTMDKNYKRGEELLYAKIDKNIVYFIDINKHDLYDREILVIIKNNWNTLLKPFESNLSYITEYSDKESIELLKNGINVPCKIDNVTYQFLGITAVGTSSTDFLYAKKLFNEIQKQYNEIMISKKGDILNKIKNINKSLMKNKNLQIHIIIKDGLLFFVDKISLTTIKFVDKNIYISDKYCDIGYHTYNFNSS